jgi:prevent-host-death family protein
MTSEIPQRELRTDTSRVLRRAEAGETLCVTVRGRPVAQLGPLAGRRRFVTRERRLARLGGALGPSEAASLREDLADAVA